MLFVVDAKASALNFNSIMEAKEYIFEVVTELDDGVDFHIVVTNTSQKGALTYQEVCVYMMMERERERERERELMDK